MAYKRKRTAKKPLRRQAYKKKRATMPNVKKLIRQAINKNIETKESVTQISDGQQIWHNNFVSISSSLLKTTPGINDPETTNTLNRIGDAINLRGLSIKMMVELNERYSDVTFRLMVVKASRGDAVDRGALFVGQSDNKMLDKFNNERFTMLYQKWFKITAPNQGTIGPFAGGLNVGGGINNADSANTVLTRATKIVKVWIPGSKFVKNGVVKYDSGGDQAKFFDYHCLLYAYSNYSTLQDDFYIARLNDAIINLYYKDA